MNDALNRKEMENAMASAGVNTVSDDYDDNDDFCDLCDQDVDQMMMYHDASMLSRAQGRMELFLQVASFREVSE